MTVLHENWLNLNEIERGFMNEIKRAKAYAKHHHFGQVDKAGVDYFLGHITTVAHKVACAKYSNEYVVVAFLHDTVEDTSATIEEIGLEFGADIANAVDAMSKRKGEDYDTYLQRILSNKLASVVKFYDMEHNSDIGRLSVVTEKDLKRREKYRKYMGLLEKNFL